MMECWTPQLVDQMLAYLKSIDQTLKLAAKARQAEAQPHVAGTADLDGKYGDPVVKFMPRFWTGDNFAGKAYSECPADLLDQIAENEEWRGNKAEAENELYKGKPTAPYRRANAAKARGWAKRKREGWVSPKQPALEPVTQGWATAAPVPLRGWATPEPASGPPLDGDEIF